MNQIDNRQQIVLAMSQSKPCFQIIGKDVNLLRNEITVDVKLRIDEAQYQVVEMKFVPGGEIKTVDGRICLLLEKLEGSCAEFVLTMGFLNWEGGPYSERYTFPLRKGDIWRVFDGMPGDCEFGKGTKRHKIV